MSPHVCSNGYNQKDKEISVDKDMEKRDPLCSASRNVN